MFLKLDDANLLVSSFGAGANTIVAQGGWVGSGELWQPPFEILSSHWRTVAYDHRGTGGSTHGAAAITFEMLVDDLFKVLDALEIGRCVLAAESAGAAVALEAALRHPERFSGLVLVDGRYSGIRSEGANRLLAGCRADFGATMDAFVNACVPEEECEAERCWGRKIVGRSDPASAIQLMECLDGITVEQRLADIRVPTLIIHGSRDVITPIESSRRLAAEIPDNRLVVIEGAGHVPTITRPAAVAAAIDDFFDEK